MAELRRPSPFGGLFVQNTASGRPRLARHPAPPPGLVDPTGRLVRIATVEVAGAICPSCDERSDAGGHVSFVADLRVVYACPECQELVWIHGA